jgi:DNA (cytosine-5)-methyltransferase 1
MAAENIHNRVNDKFPNLETVVARTMWPTPNASDNRDRGHKGMPAIKRRMEKGKQLNLSMVVSETSGSLNPQWVEWLMGYPEGWTDLED